MIEEWQVAVHICQCLRQHNASAQNRQRRYKFVAKLAFFLRSRLNFYEIQDLP